MKQSDNVSHTHAHFLAVQLVFMGVWFVSQCQSAENALKWAAVVARYIVYLLTSRGLQELCIHAYKSLYWQRLSFRKLYEENKLSWMTYAASACVLVLTNQRLLGEDFPLLFAAYLVCQFLQTEQRPRPTINYGTGMACSFFEGYLKHVIPSDGKDAGFVEKIRNWENAQDGSMPRLKKTAELTPTNENQSQQHRTKEDQLMKPSRKVKLPLSLVMAIFYYVGELLPVLESDGKDDSFVQRMCKWENKENVVFPVKQLLLVITKTLHCPPDLSDFNDPNPGDRPFIEPCVNKSLEEVKKHVAGVMNRRYSNTIYVIRWKDHQHAPVYLAAECATPLHTLYGVLNNHQLYRELVTADKEELVRDFVTQLQNILERSPATHNKCKLVFFDDSPGSKEYLPDVLLKKIEEIEPKYRDIIDRYDAEQKMEDPVPLETPLRVLRPPE